MGNALLGIVTNGVITDVPAAGEGGIISLIYVSIALAEERLLASLTVEVGGRRKSTLP